MQPISVVILISGRGSNAKAIIDNADATYQVSAVISNRPDAAGLVYAQTAGLATAVVNHRDYSNRADFEATLQAYIDQYQPDLVVLAGFMRILTAPFIRHYTGRLLNIHPSLLPDFRGLNTHARALAARVSEHGATVHFVTEDLDAGPIILQAAVPVLANDDVETLAARVLTEEHRIYPQAVRWFATGQLQLQGQYVLLNGQPISTHSGDINHENSD